MKSLVTKLVKPTKVLSSRAADDLGGGQFLITQAKSQVCARELAGELDLQILAGVWDADAVVLDKALEEWMPDSSIVPGITPGVFKRKVAVEGQVVKQGLSWIRVSEDCR